MCLPQILYSLVQTNLEDGPSVIKFTDFVWLGSVIFPLQVVIYYLCVLQKLSLWLGSYKFIIAGLSHCKAQNYFLGRML